MPGLFTMSAVDRGWPGLRDLARLISNSFVKFSMFLYERVDWLGFRDRGFTNRDLGKLAENFAI